MAPEAEAASRTFRYAITEPAGVVPADAVEPAATAVVDAIFDSLTAVGPDGEILAAAATAWEPVDGRADRWRFLLRPAATFHDGTPVTAADVAFAWAEVVRAGAAGLHLADVVGYAEVAGGTTTTLRGLTVVDALTLEVQLARPDAEFPAVATHPALAPVPRGAYAADPEAFRRRPIGNGPFAVTEQVDTTRFVRTERWLGWRNGSGPARVDGVLFEVEDLDTAYLAFRQGRRDLVTIPPEALADAAASFPDADGDPATGPGLLNPPRPSTYLLVFNASIAPYERVEVRRAVSLAVDRDELAGTVGLDPADLAAAPLELVPATGLLPPGLAEPAGAVCHACHTDVIPGASRLLAAAGVTELGIAFNAGGGHERVRDQLRGDLGVPGVTVVSNARGPTPDFATYLARLEAGGVGLFRFGWSVEYPSRGAMLRPLLHSGAIPAPGAVNARNYGRYVSAAVDGLLDRAAAELDPGRRAALFRQVERHALNSDQALVPVVTYRHTAVASDRVEGLALSPYGAVNLAEVRLAG